MSQHGQVSRLKSNKKRRAQKKIAMAKYDAVPAHRERKNELNRMRYRRRAKIAWAVADRLDELGSCDMAEILFGVNK